MISILTLGVAASLVVVLVLWSRKSRRIARRRRQYVARVAAEARSARKDVSVKAEIVAADAAATHAGQKRLAASVDLTCLEAPPDGACLPEDRPVDAATTGAILKSAEAMSQVVGRRAAILKGMSSLSQEPREVSKLVVADPTLAGQVLKTVNSAFYGLSHPVASVFRAVLLLGHLEVRNIIWRSCLSEGMGSDQGPTRDALEAIWQHSFATSRVAYALAKSLGLAAPDEVSTAALLHDIGKVFCLKTKPFLGLALYGEAGFSNLERLKQELAELEFSHASLGGRIVGIWGLPEESRAAIGLHHMPSYVDPDGANAFSRVIGVIYLADVLCHAAARPVGRDGNHPIYLPRQAWLKLLGAGEGIEHLCTESVVQALSRPTRALEMVGVSAEAAYSAPDL